MVLDSSSRHEDSAGHAGTIGTQSAFCLSLQMLTLCVSFSVQGGVQWMCAGKGIIHAEMPVHTKGAPDPRGLQLWIDLPKEVSSPFAGYLA